MSLWVQTLSVKTQVVRVHKHLYTTGCQDGMKSMLPGCTLTGLMQHRQVRGPACALRPLAVSLRDPAQHGLQTSRCANTVREDTLRETRKHTHTHTHKPRETLGGVVWHQIKPLQLFSCYVTNDQQSPSRPHQVPDVSWALGGHFIHYSSSRVSVVELRMVLIQRFLLCPHHFFFTAAEQCPHSEPNLKEKHFLLFINNLYGFFLYFCDTCW